MELFTNGYTYALLALAHAEGATKLYLIAYVAFCDEALKLLNYLTRALDVAGATDTYCDFKHLFVSVSFICSPPCLATAEFLYFNN